MAKVGRAKQRNNPGHFGVGKDYAFTGPDLSDKKYEALLGVGVGVALRKDETQLTKELNSAIQTIRTNGVYTKLAAKYFDFDVYGK